MTTNEHGPDNPRPWDANHPSLKSHLAPHETRAVMRMHRAGWPGGDIHKMLKLKGSQLLRGFRFAMEEEDLAHRSRRPIHDATVERGTV